MTPRKIFPVVVTLLLLIGCDAVDSMTDGYSHAQAVAARLENSLGLKSFVGFNQHNGVLGTVTVTFEGVPKTPSLQEISARTQEVVLAEFKQTPASIVVGFSMTQ